LEQGKLDAQSLRGMAARSMTAISPQVWDTVFRCFRRFTFQIRQQMSGDKLHKFAEILPVKSPEAMYHALISHWNPPLSSYAHMSPHSLDGQGTMGRLHNFTQWMMYLDSVTYHG
jgi:asparagine synthase (glutamine-hydrolysing)